jgi:hypothetical protein
MRDPHSSRSASIGPVQAARRAGEAVRAVQGDPLYGGFESVIPQRGEMLSSL